MTNTAPQRATLVGLTALLMWTTLASLTTLSGDIPPFQMLALCFGIASLIGLADWRRRGIALRDGLRLPPVVWAVGVYGLFGYHFAYFIALRNAPPVEAGLIAYLWPLLIVLLSAALPGERLRPRHVVGALAGFGGAALLVSRGGGPSFDRQYLLGYLFALACAVIWSTYSVGSRMVGRRHPAAATTASVAAFCLVTAVLSAVCHLLLEETVLPSAGEWVALVALGLGPVGLAFYTWDYGVKHGDLRLLGVLSYGTPLVSTLLLIGLGLAEPSWALAAATLLIVVGAAVASRK